MYLLRGGHKFMFGNINDNQFSHKPIMTSNGTQISVSGNTITTTDGRQFHYSGGILYGPNNYMSMNVKSMDEAIGIVTGMCGGKLF